MKIKTLLSLLTLTTLFYSCRQEKSINEQMEAKTTICYQSISEKDTAWLKIDTSKRDIIGFLSFKYASNKNYDGQFKGKMYGDTLKGHFDFTVNKVDKWYRNPVAFLKRDGKLTMGVGDFNMVWGSPIFDPKTIINYNKGRFVFEMEDCK
jgi:hypothetical protein